MTLTLDDVRRVRFRMARRSGHGYEVSDVDTFVDRVEESFNQMTNDAELLQRQIESLQASAPDSAFAPVSGPSNSGEADELRAQLEAVRGELNQAREDANRLRVEGEEVSRLAAENERLRGEVQQARSQAAVVVPAEGAYVERVEVATTSEAAPAVVRLVQLATEQAEQVVNEATAEATRKLAEAEQRAFEITTDARTKADRVESEARVNVEKMTHDAGERAAQIEHEAAARRTELFAALERERDELVGKVSSLRGFEASFRDSLTKHLTSHLDALKQARPEPVDVPELAQRPDGATPRLDALMEEQH